MGGRWKGERKRRCNSTMWWPSPSATEKGDCRAFLPVHRQSDGHSRCACCTGTRWSNCTEDRGDLLVDVPVIFNDKFLQSKEFDLVVPQIQFIVRVPDILPVLQRCTHSAYCAETVAGTAACSQGRRPPKSPRFCAQFVPFCVPASHVTLSMNGKQARRKHLSLLSTGMPTTSPMKNWTVPESAPQPEALKGRPLPPRTPHRRRLPPRPTPSRTRLWGSWAPWTNVMLTSVSFCTGLWSPRGRGSLSQRRRHQTDKSSGQQLPRECRPHRTRPLADP